MLASSIIPSAYINKISKIRYLCENFVYSSQFAFTLLPSFNAKFGNPYNDLVLCKDITDYLPLALMDLVWVACCMAYMLTCSASDFILLGSQLNSILEGCQSGCQHRCIAEAVPAVNHTM